jgi:hypothetical protein
MTSTLRQTPSELTCDVYLASTKSAPCLFMQGFLSKEIKQIGHYTYGCMPFENVKRNI